MGPPSKTQTNKILEEKERKKEAKRERQSITQSQKYWNYMVNEGRKRTQKHKNLMNRYKQKQHNKITNGINAAMKNAARKKVQSKKRSRTLTRNNTKNTRKHSKKPRTNLSNKTTL